MGFCKVIKTTKGNMFKRVSESGSVQQQLNEVSHMNNCTGATQCSLFEHSLLCCLYQIDYWLRVPDSVFC